jgi:hypothetical protein
MDYKVIWSFFDESDDFTAGFEFALSAETFIFYAQFFFFKEFLEGFCQGGF